MTVERGEEPPQVRVQCPRSVEVNERIECTYTRTDGDRATRWSWSDSDGGSGRSRSYSVRFSSPGTKTVYLVAGNGGGDGRRGQDTVTVERTPPPTAPVGRISCPPRIVVRSTLTCTWQQTGGDPATSWVWSGADSSGSTQTYSERFSVLGTQTVRLTVSNSGGSANARLTVRGVAPTTYTYARCGSDAIKVYWFNKSRLGKHWLNMTWEQIQRRVPGWGEHLIGHLSQAECNSWPDEPPITNDTWTNDWS